MGWDRRAIPTVYGGVQFRSRLEARWAAFFDRMGWQYQYEPFDCDGWIPDFVLLFPKPVLVEVKPASDVESLHEFTRKIDASSARDEVLLVGSTPFLASDDWLMGVLGLLRQTYQGDNGDEHDWDLARSFHCCGSKGPHPFGFCHESGSWRCRVCGHFDGDRTWSGDHYERGAHAQWTLAANDTQWKSPRLVN